MNIHEHQAKDILREYGVPVSKGVVIFSENEIIVLNTTIPSNLKILSNLLELCQDNGQHLKF